MEHYSARRNEYIILSGIIWIELEEVMLSETSQKRRTKTNDLTHLQEKEKQSKTEQKQTFVISAELRLPEEGGEG